MPPGTTEENSENIEDSPKDSGDDIRIYHFVQSGWRTTTKLASGDIAVIVDSSKTEIYVWEGRQDLPRIREQAKSALLSLKLQYPKYNFRAIQHSKGFRRLKKQRTIPEPILNTLQHALKS